MTFPSFFLSHSSSVIQLLLTFVSGIPTKKLAEAKKTGCIEDVSGQDRSDIQEIIIKEEFDDNVQEIKAEEVEDVLEIFDDYSLIIKKEEDPVAELAIDEKSDENQEVQELEEPIEPGRISSNGKGKRIVSRSNKHTDEVQEELKIAEGSKYSRFSKHYNKIDGTQLI